MIDPERLSPIFTYCLGFAKQMLEDSGTFLPFAATLSASDEVKSVGGWTGNEHPAPAEVYDLLAKACQSEASQGAIHGAALAIDVNIPAEYTASYPDGIRVQLEGDGYARYIYVPYILKASGILRRKRDVLLAEPFAVEITPNVFAA